MEIITSDDILGKDVIDTEGQIIGVVQQLRIDKKSKKIVGILIDQGFMKPDLFVGIDAIKNLGVDSIFLKKSPSSKIKGIEVYDSNGKKVGVVHDIIKGKSNISAILVKQGPLSKPFKIKAQHIKTIGFSVILKIPQSNLETTSQK